MEPALSEGSIVLVCGKNNTHHMCFRIQAPEFLECWAWRPFPPRACCVTALVAAAALLTQSGLLEPRRTPTQGTLRWGTFSSLPVSLQPHFCQTPGGSSAWCQNLGQEGHFLPQMLDHFLFFLHLAPVPCVPPSFSICPIFCSLSPHFLSPGTPCSEEGSILFWSVGMKKQEQIVDRVALLCLCSQRGS